MKISFYSLHAATAVAAVLLLSSQAVLATDPEDFGFDTTEDLYEVCSTPVDVPEHVPAALACRAFIEATVQYHDEVVDRQNLKRLVCYNETVTIEDARQVFIEWGAKNRKDKKLRKEQPVVGLMRSLSQAYPCP
ncbi:MULTISPECIES: Rap1a/Tai family immunity protein [Thiorhodovibrio]|uniref:Rap1a/Tai family immunity protein n=1 Tax=Thiorhodovibrio TaxID=61593 RepID=UPI00191473C0|nr:MULTISPECIES: Rap1a/Tai family immunity protein [Thiorhodovibrio]WPL14050.1 hypothetical protein Thiosp_03882 [Thiorhodovibrio litoralis]